MNKEKFHKDRHCMVPPIRGSLIVKLRNREWKIVYYGLGGRGNGESIFIGYKVSVMQYEKALEMCCVSLWLYLTMLHCAFTNSLRVDLTFRVLITIQKNTII